MTTSLRAGLSFCTLGGHIVFLDLPADRYFALSQALEITFKKAVAGISLSETERSSLVKAQLIAPGSAPLSLRPSEAIRPNSSVFEASRPDFHWPDVGSLAFRIFRARLNLRFKGLPATVAHLMRHKPHSEGNEAQASSSIPGALFQAAAAQHACARLFGSHDLCLPYAIAVARHLHARGVPADLVIAVGMPPFRAHAWVQWRDVLINERLEIAAHYTPIAVL